MLIGDTVELSTAHGLADVERAVPMTTEHLFRIASHSKTFTSTAVLQLVEQGRLRLDDTAGSWVPYLVEQQSPLADVTVRELLSHAGGVYRDSRDGDFWQLRRRFPDRGQLRDLLVAPESAVVPRSERFKYSNIGYALLGLVIEAASGNDYADQLRHAVVEPLGLPQHRRGARPGQAGRLRHRLQRARVRRHAGADRARRHPGDGAGHRLLLHGIRPGDVLLRALPR